MLPILITVLFFAKAAFAVGCDQPLGMHSGAIPDSALSCSSSYNKYHACGNARLNRNLGVGAWCTKTSDINPYISISLPQYHYITKIATQGRNSTWQQHVKTFSIYYQASDGAQSLSSVRDQNGRTKTFVANTDGTGVVTNDFNIWTNFIFVRPTTYTPTNMVCLRLELYGCTSKPTAPPTTQPPDYCAVNNGGCQQLCKSGSTGPICSCHGGYTANGTKCVDINECDLKTDNCDLQTTVCENLVPGFKCNCKSSEMEPVPGDNRKCQYIDYCNTGKDNCDKGTTTCVNTSPGFKCQCKPGFETDPLSKTKCKDINECEKQTDQCDRQTTDCKNTIGSYTCHCKQSGFKLDSTGKKCIDIIECDTNNGGCAQHCHNTPGSFYCSCKSGYNLVNKTKCVDINECDTNNGGCEQLCNNFAGGYKCSCRVGYKEKGDKNCEDIDECLSNNGNCAQICKNNIGSYTCSCRPGYKRVGTHNCEDINECSQSPPVCDNTTSTCRNNIGSYVCDCNPGYEKSSGQCIGIKCTALSPPKFGKLEPTKCSLNEARYPDKCFYMCNSGYSLSQSSASYAMCQADGQWKLEAGKYNPTCEVVVSRCPVISSIPNADITDYDCTTTGAAVGRQCKVLCKGGYDLVGTGVITCLSTKQYDSNFANTKCVPKPTISCPSTVHKEALPFGQSQMKILFTDYTTNVERARVTSKPDGMLTGKGSLPLGTHLIVLTATNEAGSVAKCDFQLRVLDKEPPRVTNCLENQYRTINGQTGKVVWDEPTFSDNVNLEKVVKSMENGGTLGATVYFVSYTAVDTSQNSAKCHFFVHVRSQTCDANKIPGGNGCTKQVVPSTGGLIIYLIKPVGTVYSGGISTPFLSYSCSFSEGRWRQGTTVVTRMVDCVQAVQPTAGACPAGYQLTADKSRCEICPVGSMYNATTKVCTLCPVNSYQDKTGQSSCVQCANGTMTSFEGATSSLSCTDTCLAGYFSQTGTNEKDKGQCRPCPIGSYQPEVGQTTCKICPQNANTQTSGSKVIKQCILPARIFQTVPVSRLAEAKEGGNVTLECYAYGLPLPTMSITNSTNLAPAFVRGKQTIELLQSKSPYIVGIRLTITKVFLTDNAKYTCFARNNIGTVGNQDDSVFHVSVTL